MFYQDQVRDALTLLRCSSDFLCSVAGLSSTRLSKFMRGTTELSAPELNQLLNTIKELRGLQADCTPVPVAFQHAILIKQLLERRRNGLRVIAFGLDSENAVIQTRTNQ